MAASSGRRTYPPLLFRKGKAPLQEHSLNYNCFVSNIKTVQEKIGIDAWDEVKKSSVGVIAKLIDVNYIWCAKVVHYLLTHQLATKKNYELWSLIDCQPIRLSLLEFGNITGLNCEAFKAADSFDVDHTPFWSEMNVPTSRGPCLNQLRLVLDRCTNWSFEKRRMVGWLCLLSIGIFGVSPSTRIPLECAKRVLDPEAFESYPWGRVACKSLMNSIKIASYTGKKSVTLCGLVHVLLIWAYEAIIGVGELYGNKKRLGEAEKEDEEEEEEEEKEKEEEEEEVPLLSWGGGRRRFEFKDFIANEKEAHSKIRVRHFFPQLSDKLIPEWDDEVSDEEVDNLLEDLKHNRLDENAWDTDSDKNNVGKKTTKQAKKRKDFDGGSAADKAREMKKNYQKVQNDEEAPEAVPKEAEAVENRHGEGEMRGDQRMSFFELLGISGIVDMIKTLTDKMDNMDNNLPN